MSSAVFDSRAFFSSCAAVRVLVASSSLVWRSALAFFEFSASVVRPVALVSSVSFSYGTD